MPAQPFTVHVDPDDLARQDIAAAVSRPAATGKDSGRPETAPARLEHHGAHDDKLAARQHAKRDRAGHASGTGSGRSYAFRRS